jgi:tetratricopeptide (TPR) repeat protein
MALDAVDELSTGIVEEYLSVLPHSEMIKREIQQKAIHFYEIFTDKNEHDPTLRSETAMAYHRLGWLHFGRDEFSGAMEAHRRCLALLRDLAAEAPNPREENSFKLAQCEADLGLVLWRVGRITEATRVLPDAIITMERLVREFPEKPEYEWALADTEARLALCHCTSRRSTEFESWTRRSLARKLRLIAKPPQSDKDWLNFSNSYQDLGGHYRHQGNIETAKKCFQEAIRWRRKALDQVPDSSHCSSGDGPLATWGPGNQP